MVASTGSVSVVTTPPLIPSYQWRRGFAAIAGANSQTYTLQAADADSIIDCVVSVTNAGGTATRNASITVGTQASVTWTTITPAATSRIVYVAEDGDDVAAANVYGRGYYLPLDSEIGADPTQPSGTVVAYRTIGAARAKASQSWWLLLRRGDTFPITLHQAFGSPWIGAGVAGAPSVICAWGPDTEPRPIISKGPSDQWTGGGDGPEADLLAPHRYWMHLDFDIETTFYTGSANIPSDGMLFEGCRFRRALDSTDRAWIMGIVFRRCAVEGAWNATGRNQGLYVTDWAYMPSGDNRRVEMVIEECVFDRNGYRENPFDATTWTSKALSPHALPAGQGVQPRRTFEDRNMYLNTYVSMTVRGSIFSRDGGGSSVQMREGGIAERNLFMWNESALGLAHPQRPIDAHKGAIAKDNVVLHDDCFLPPGGWGQGLLVGGSIDDVAAADGNIVAHFHRNNSGEGSVVIWGKPFSPLTLHPAAKLMRGVATNNAVFQEFGAVGILVNSTAAADGVIEAEIVNNAVSNVEFLNNFGILSDNRNATLPSGTTYSGNKYHSPSGSGRFMSNAVVTTFSGWRSAGFDTDATFTNDFAAFKASVNWTAPERDIVSYMQSVDAEYVVDENVYIDEDAIVKQSARQRLWEVLSDSSQYPSGSWEQERMPLTEARAKRAARRFHAFVTFIQRAKENRKGAWDPRWTAEAVNNYIREGFGKTAVTGAYDNRPLAERLLDYTT